MVSGGYNNGDLDSVEIYDPTDNTWHSGKNKLLITKMFISIYHSKNKNKSKCITTFGINCKSNYSPFCITGPSLPYGLNASAMAESPDGRGVLLFGGDSTENGYEKRILELRTGADSWNILNVSLENGRYEHIVIPLT